MAKPVYIRITEPCHQNWAEMTPTQQGAYCKSCKKNVVDFTAKTENEVYQIVTEPGAQLCGRFYAHQLQQPIRKTEVNNGFMNWRAIAASLAAMAGISQTVQAGDTDVKPLVKSDTVNVADTKLPTPLTNPVIEPPITQIVMGITAATPDLTLTIKGRVLDADTKEPIMAATVSLKHGGRNVVTDSLGYFDLGVSATDYDADTLTVQARWVWYKGSQMPVAEIKPGQPVILTLKEEPIILGGMSVITVETDPFVLQHGGYNDLTPLLEQARKKKTK
jgi:hypothetical protein